MGRLNIGLLRLLVKGEWKYIDWVGKVLHGRKVAQPGIELSPATSYANWPWSRGLVVDDGSDQNVRYRFAYGFFAEGV